MIAKIMRVLKNMFGDGTKIHCKEIAVPELEWHTADLQNGWTGNLYYAKNIFGQVMIKASNLGNGTAEHRTIIASLPAGYKPFVNCGVGIAANCTNVGPYGAMLGFIVDNAGDIRIVDPLATVFKDQASSVPTVSFQAIYMGN